MNEPSPGYIGVEDVTKLFSPLKREYMPTIFQQMTLGSGITQKVSRHNTIGMATGSAILNPKGVSVWSDGKCIWEEHGVWERGPDGQGKLLEIDYFQHYRQGGKSTGRKADFGKYHYVPFAMKFQAAMQAAFEGSASVVPLCFVELPPADLGVASVPTIPKVDVPYAVNAAHWYDNMTLFMGSFMKNFSLDVQTLKPAFGSRQVRELFRKQLEEVKELGKHEMGGVPTLIGECGIPFNMEKRAGYNSGDWKRHTEAMDFTISALELNLLNYTLWCYAPDHCPAWGDGWNLEDLSIFSKDEKVKADAKFGENINNGGRATHAVARPYAFAIAGEPLEMHFNLASRCFKMEFEQKEDVSKHTEVFIPRLHYPDGFKVQCKVKVNGTWRKVTNPRWTAHPFDQNGMSIVLIYKHPKGFKNPLDKKQHTRIHSLEVMPAVVTVKTGCFCCVGQRVGDGAELYDTSDKIEYEELYDEDPEYLERMGSDVAPPDGSSTVELTEIVLTEHEPATNSTGEARGDSVPPKL